MATDIREVSRAALALAQHLRKCWPIQGQSVTPAGPPRGRSFGRRLAMLVSHVKALEWVLPCDSEASTLEAADAIDCLRRAVLSLRGTFGLDGRRIITEPSKVPEVAPEAISVLEWVAAELEGKPATPDDPTAGELQEAPEPASGQPSERQRQRDGMEPAARAIGIMHDLLTTTKRLPTLKAIAGLLEVSDRTLRGPAYKAFHKAWKLERNSRRCKHHAKAEKRK